MASRYLIGIDLGTTNSVVAYIDTQNGVGGEAPIRVLPIPQLLAHGEVRTLPALPSFLYFPTQDELSAGTVCATWDEDPPILTGVHAREQGALTPSRQVSSAKSWLTNSDIDRRARILPAQAEPSQPRISPVEASARYLMHLRDTWNSEMATDAEARFEHQEIFLTVPASFHEDARELTVEAAYTAKLEKLTLLEEPLAAFYAWIAANSDAPLRADLGLEWANNGLKDGDLVLICDIGGGTSDFSLVRARRINGELEFERTAIGEHLLLGGDNLDSALAQHVEAKLGNINLNLRQRFALRRVCCTAKEQLLQDSHLERVPITILGTGRAVVGQSLSVDLTRDEVIQILSDGFLPITAPGDLPARGRRTGLRELGLPYASDPAITKHLASFLTQAAAVMNSSATDQRMVQPNAVLFNGGFCTPAVAQERIIEALSAWFGKTGWRPKVLHNNSVESSVARGAAYYGKVRRGIGRRIGAGSPRTYYIGLGSDPLEGICVLPAGVNEGTTLPLLNREFSVLANRSVSFSLFSSRTRHDAHGEIVALDEADVDHHPPLVTMLRHGRRMRERRLNVRLRASFTEVGTLELWCESPDSQHRWRLQFELRGQAEQAQQQTAMKSNSALPRSSGDTDTDTAIESAVRLIRSAFGKSSGGDAVTPETLVNRLETTLGANRDSWPLSAIRRLADALLEVAAGRNQSPQHEMRWLNLSGFCLRPGLGVEEDAARVKDLLTIVSHELAFKNELQSQVQSLLLLRRIAGGISANSQLALFRRQTTPAGQKKQGRENPHVEHERWRLLASLEHLLADTRTSLGEKLLVKIKDEPDDAICLWSLGRLGARIPLYGPLHSVVAAATAGEWLKALLDLPLITAATQSAIVQLARRTDDGLRDVNDTLREKAIAKLTNLGAADDTIQLLSRYVPPERADAVRSFGESLPPGLQVIGSSNCMLSVPALSNLRE